MNKATARKVYVEKRNQLSYEEIQVKSSLIAETFIASDIWKTSKLIHVFITIPSKAEIDTSFLIDFFFKKHPEIKICTSIVVENDLLHTHITEATTYLPNGWNIHEPVERNVLNENEIDLVLLPLLAFDVKGNRVGYGKGFYDRFLQKCRPDVVKVGLSLFQPTEELIDVDVWDVPLDWAVSPSKIYNISN